MFGLQAYVRLCLNAGDTDEAARAIGDRKALHHLCPGRRRFHASEFLAFQSMMGRFCVAKGEVGQAEIYLKMLKDPFPDEPATRDLEHAVRMAKSFGKRTLMEA